jgi:hypothetical protein
MARWRAFAAAGQATPAEPSLPSPAYAPACRLVSLCRSSSPAAGSPTSCTQGWLADVIYNVGDRQYRDSVRSPSVGRTHAEGLTGEAMKPTSPSRSFGSFRPPSSLSRRALLGATGGAAAFAALGGTSRRAPRTPAGIRTPLNRRTIPIRRCSTPMEHSGCIRPQVRWARCRC